MYYYSQSAMKKKQNKYVLAFLTIGLFLIIQLLAFLPKQSPPRQTFISKAAGTSPTLSNSKLGIFILSNYSAGAKRIIDAGPKIVKVMVDPTVVDPAKYDDQLPLLQALKDYKIRFTAGKTILRLFNPQCNSTCNNQFCYDDKCTDINHSTPTTAPEASAIDYFTNLIRPTLDFIKKKGDYLNYVDYIESPNESENITDWDNPGNVKWLNYFWKKLAQLNITTYGLGTCAGAIATGDVGGSSPEEIGRGVENFIPALQYLKANKGAWCYHAHNNINIDYTTNVEDEKWYSLRYRFFYDFLRTNGLADMPMILDEVGIDYLGDPNKGGWKKHGDQQKYENWLQWFDSQIKQDSYILGGAIFQIGDPDGWPSYNIEDLADDLTQYLNNNKIQPTNTPVPINSPTLAPTTEPGTMPTLTSSPTKAAITNPSPNSQPTQPEQNIPSLSASFVPDNLVKLKNYISSLALLPKDKADTMQIKQDAVSYLVNFLTYLKSVEKANGDPLCPFALISSAYRSYQEEKEQIPGSSPHQAGIAVDLFCYQYEKIVQGERVVYRIKEPFGFLAMPQFVKDKAKEFGLLFDTVAKNQAHVVIVGK